MFGADTLTIRKGWYVTWYNDYRNKAWNISKRPSDIAHLWDIHFMAGTLHRETIHLVKKTWLAVPMVDGTLGQCLGEHNVEFFTCLFNCKCRSGSWGFLRYLEIPEEERTHIWFNQKQVQKTKHHCSGTVVADTSWPARAKGLFESANVSYLNVTMENHHSSKAKHL